jgi:glycosyltransferase involved in cell wall biosynthesis
LTAVFETGTEMQSRLLSPLIMLGAAAETRGSIAAVVDAYRVHGLFKRWPVEYVETHASAGVLQAMHQTLKAAARFASLLARERRAAVHVHSSARTFWRDVPFIAAALTAKCPTLLQLHGGGFERLHDEASTPARAAFQAVLERAAGILVPAESLRTWVQRMHRNAPVYCMPMPVSVPPVRRNAHRGNVVLFLGRLEAAKGIFDLLEAVAVLRATAPDVRLVCAGEGDRPEVARYAERLGIREAVKFTGWVGPSGKRALFESAAVFALPSYSAGLPIGLLEAMSAGVPVVATPVGGIPEVLADGVSGLLVAPGDTATLSRRLGKLLLDPALAERIGGAARESVRRRHSPERALAQLEALYASLGIAALGTREPARPHVDFRKAA